MARQKLTARTLDKLTPGEIVRDATVHGLFAECSKTGSVVSLKIQADLGKGMRNDKGKPISVRMTLGQHPELTLDAARPEAMRLLAMIKAGTDPRVSSNPQIGEGVWTVGRMRDEYVADLRIRERSTRTIEEVIYLFDRYLPAWLQLPVNAVNRDMVREAHTRITTDHGKSAANHALKAARTCFQFVLEKTGIDLPKGNPVAGATFHPIRPRKDRPDFELPPVAGWLPRVRALKNKRRALMHELGLFTGLRPGTLVALERAWVRLEDKAIVVPGPRMKGRREFACPLSSHALTLVQRALVTGAADYPDSPYLFPTLDNDGAVVATVVWKEKKLPTETGHIVRHMYSNAANEAGVSSVNRQLLLAQTVPGVEGVYLSERALFATLLVEQERITAHILAKMPAQTAAAAE